MTNAIEQIRTVGIVAVPKELILPSQTLSLTHEPIILEGELNVNELRGGPVLDGVQRKVLRRYPKRNTQIFELLSYEYSQIGFIQAGGRFRRRSQAEQVQFSRQCAELGLNVFPPFSVRSKYIENLFLEGAEKMDDFLMHASDQQVTHYTEDIFMDLYKAHDAGIIYGDRWAENILVVPKLGIVNIDFDIEISGPFAREFEASQIAIYVLGSAKAKSIPQLAKLLTLPFANLDIRFVESFLRGHLKHYDHDNKYGDMENELNALIALMHTEHESQKQGEERG